MSGEHFGWPRYYLNPDVYHSPEERAEYDRVRLTYQQARAQVEALSGYRPQREILVEARRKASLTEEIKKLERSVPTRVKGGHLSYAQIALMEWRMNVGEKDVGAYYMAIKEGIAMDKARAAERGKVMKVKMATFVVALVIGLFLTMVFVG